MAEQELDLGPARLSTRGGLYSASVERLWAPRSSEEAVSVFRQAAERSRAIALVGAQRSFEGHFLPPAGGVAISSERLTGDVRVLGKNDDGSLRVRALAGTSFRELLAAVHGQGYDHMPFSCPTSEAISLGGALGTNTHGRTTDTYGGFFADHVTSFQLVCPDGSVRECSEHAPGELERRLFRYVPGALGALGLVTEIELELCAVSPRSRVQMQVLSEHTADPLAAVDSYLEHAEANQDEQGFRFSEGVGLVCFGPPQSGKALVVARRRTSDARDGVTLPLFDGRGSRNALLQLLVHRFPAPAQWLVPRLLKRGKRYTSDYYDWAFFQSSHDQADRVFERASAGVRAIGLLLGVDPKLTLVHVGWVVPRPAMRDFMQLYFAMLYEPEHRPIGPHLELQDVLPLPQCRWPLNASYRHEQGSHVLTWSCRVLHGRAELLEQATRFCRELSRRARELGALVQLIKQLHVDDDLLRAMHREPLAELRAIKREVDPHNVLRSRSLDRLGFAPSSGAER